MPKKLTPQDLQTLRELLLQVRGAITGDIQKLREDAFHGDEQRDSVDVIDESGADVYSQDFNLELLALDESSLREVDEALERMEDGSYGLCEECGGRIRLTRLRALPYARTCFTCQRELERPA